MDSEFKEFYIWAKKELGLDLISYKQKQLQRRINTVRDKAGAENLKEYSKMLEEDKEVRDIFLDYITINVTEFYRNRDIFEDFERLFMEEVVANYDSYKLWSAACSNGSEPYTLSMILDKNNILNKSKIIATDIDDNILDKAKKGLYNEEYLKNLTEDEKNNYFDKKDDKFLIKNKFKRKIEFKKHDLILDSYERGLNAIVCRNVTIYFKDETKDDIYRRMSEALLPKGLLFTGATEFIYNPEKLGLRKLQTFIYQKVD